MTNSPFLKLSFARAVLFQVEKFTDDILKENILKEKNPLSGFCYFTAPPSPPGSSFRFPGCHAGDSGEDQGVGDVTEREHEHIFAQGGSVGAGGGCTCSGSERGLQYLMSHTLD